MDADPRGDRMPRLTKLSRSIAGRAALVTGAASGMGRATAHLFADEGAHVAVTDRSAEAVDAVVREITAAGGSAHGWAMDVTDGARVTQVVDEAAARFGRLDILVNNAGVGGPGSIETTSEEDWDRVLAANVRSGFLCSKYALPHLRATGGVILFTASIAGIEGALQLVSYATSKAAIINLVRAMALDHAREGIRVNVVCPGATDTPMLREGLEKNGIPIEAFASRLPTQRLVTAEEVAEAFLFLASDAARSITGQTLVIDGGFTAGDYGWMPMPRP
jgi:NAD(P)-dependent dehydrogenase (short-subunit alcohol dehydrogenase family)